MTSSIEKIINMKTILIKKINDINKYNKKLPTKCKEYFFNILHNYVDALEKINYISIFGLGRLQELDFCPKFKCIIRDSYNIFSGSVIAECERIENNSHTHRERFLKEAQQLNRRGFNILYGKITFIHEGISQKVFSVEKLKQKKIDEKFNFICENWKLLKSLIIKIKIIDLSVSKKILDNKDYIKTCLDQNNKKVLTKIKTMELQNLSFRTSMVAAGREKIDNKDYIKMTRHRDKKILTKINIMDHEVAKKIDDLDTKIHRDKKILTNMGHEVAKQIGSLERKKYISRYEFMKYILASVIFNLCICICILFKK